MIDHIMSDSIAIPAQAGIQALFLLRQKSLDSRFHGNDSSWGTDIL
jgi:hypothetical protein